MSNSYTPVYPDHEQLNAQGAQIPVTLTSSSATGQTKKSGSIYWILAGAAAVVVFLFGSLCLIVGTGVYFYAGKADRTAEKFPSTAEKTNPTEKLNEVNPSAPVKPVAITNEYIKAVFAVKPRAGRFTRSKTLDDRAKGYFLAADSEAGAIYSDTGKREDVMIDIAYYKSKISARNEFFQTYETAKKSGTKVSKIVEDEKTINAAFQIKKFSVLTFCNLQGGPDAYCYRLSSFNKRALLDFHDAYFAK